MKKVKIMLLSLALFAVVGGALAFKAKFNSEFCTTTPIATIVPQDQCLIPQGGGAYLPCTSTEVNSTTDEGNIFVCYTPKPFGLRCTRDNVTCPTPELITKNN